MSFTADVHRIAEKMGDSVENVAAATFIELFSSVIKDTPVDVGRLRGNWQTTKNSPAQSEIQRIGGAGPIAEAHAVVRKPDLYYLTNNLPYAEKVEFGGYGAGPKTVGGFSIKAPRGMVRINVKRLKSILRRKAR
jgi:hypothetical protein